MRLRHVITWFLTLLITATPLWASCEEMMVSASMSNTRGGGMRCCMNSDDESDFPRAGRVSIVGSRGVVGRADEAVQSVPVATELCLCDNSKLTTKSEQVDAHAKTSKCAIAVTLPDVPRLAKLGVTVSPIDSCSIPPPRSSLLSLSCLLTI
ncbi:MAG: hypothetical protein K8S99_06790 [Planctomycetes bacterium]|nr:hypothetical protein [Planctomycetota bacterium]